MAFTFPSYNSWGQSYIPCQNTPPPSDVGQWNYVGWYDPSINRLEAWGSNPVTQSMVNATVSASTGADSTWRQVMLNGVWYGARNCPGQSYYMIYQFSYYQHPTLTYPHLTHYNIGFGPHPQ